MVKIHPDVAVWWFTIQLQYISRHKNCTSAVEVLFFPCNRMSKEVFYLQKKHHLTDTTVKISRLTFPTPLFNTLCLSALLLLNSLPCILIPCFGFNCLISSSHFVYLLSSPALIPTYLLLSHPVCILSSTPRVSRCHTSPQMSSLDVHTAKESGTHMGTPSHCTTTQC